MNIHEKKAKYDELRMEADALRASVNVLLKDWMICTMFHYDEIKFAACKVGEHGEYWATLSSSEIEEHGSYSSEDLIPVLKAIQDYIAGEE